MQNNKIKILKLINNNRHAIVELFEIDDLNPKPYLVRKIIAVKKEPIVTINGALLTDL